MESATNANAEVNRKKFTTCPNLRAGILRLDQVLTKTSKVKKERQVAAL